MRRRTPTLVMKEESASTPSHCSSEGTLDVSESLLLFHSLAGKTEPGVRQGSEAAREGAEEGVEGRERRKSHVMCSSLSNSSRSSSRKTTESIIEVSPWLDRLPGEPMEEGGAVKWPSSSC